MVYGVPEIGLRDDALRVKCESWNKSLHQAYSDIGTRMEFISVTKDLQDKMCDTFYGEFAAGQLGQRLGRWFCAFLGLRPAVNPPQRTWGVNPTTTIMTAVRQAILCHE